MRAARVATLLAALGLLGAAPARVDTLIRGGTVHDGGARAAIVGDVEIVGDRIVYVGPPRGTSAARTIDARGMIVAPGFIDAHTHPDSYIRSADPAARANAPWLAQGVSTIVTGVDGYGTPDVAKDAATLAAHGIGTNVVPFVGFGAVRGRVIGAADRAPSAAELARMRAMVARAMCDGAAGFSTGLFYAPQSYATTDEVIALAREAGSRGGLYDTHQRDESSYTIGLMASVDEALRIGRQSGSPTHFAHLKALGVDVEGKAPALIARIEAARAAGQDVTADQYPYLASGSALDAALLPGWALAGGYRATVGRLRDMRLQSALQTAMADNLRRRGGADAILFTSPGETWSGVRLDAVARGWNLSPVDAAIRILLTGADDPQRSRFPGIAIASFTMSEADVETIMRRSWVVTGSDGSDGHPRQYGTFPEKYRRYVVERRVLSLADFIRGATGRTADIYRLKDRGYLRRGAFADVVVIDPERYRAEATYAKPRRLASGVRALFVNGTMAFGDGAATGALPGRVLLRPMPRGCPPRG